MPAETTNYMILGFAVVAVVLGLHLASFPIRIRSLRADLAALQPARKPAAKKRKPAAKAATKRKAASKRRR